jgi:hypothetical protein
MATPTWGTHGVLDTRAARIAASTPAIDIQGDIAAEIRRLLGIHNAQVNDMFGDFVAGTTTEQYVPVDNIGEMTLTELDEWGTPEAQKTEGGAAFALPFRLFARGLQWNYRFLKVARAEDYIKDTQALMLGDVKNTKYRFLTTLFRPANYTFKDHLYNNASLDVKCLANADSMYISPTPDGVSIDASTHTHYLANATLTAAFMIACGDTVAEHNSTGQTVISIPRAAEATVRAMTGTNEFVPYPNPAVTYSPDTVLARGRSLDIRQTYDRAIGVIGPSAYEVRVKPWVPANYGTVHQEGAPKVIVKRLSPVADEMGLHVRFNGEIDPLVADVMENLFDFGVVNRVNAAVFRFNNGTYAAPTLTV